MKYNGKRRKGEFKTRGVSDLRYSFSEATITIATRRGEVMTVQGTVDRNHDNISHDLSCPSGKDVYRTFNHANRALKSRRGEVDKYVYRCDMCGYYHLTTKEQQKPRKHYQRKQKPIRYSQAELDYIQSEKRRKNPNKAYNVFSATDAKKCMK
jgi:hypothetical protein